MKNFEAICWMITLLMCIGAGLRMLNLWLSPAASAPQYVAEAAGIMVMVLVPFIFTRAVQEMRRLNLK